MMDLVTQRFAQWGTISPEDHHLIGALKSYKARCLSPRHVIAPSAGKGIVSFVLRGWICQYGQLHDGRRQILSLILPGDFVICSQTLSRDTDPPLHTLTETVLLDVPAEKFEVLCATSPKLASLVKQTESVQAATSREWVLSLGVRKAKERCAHLICEVLWRLRSVKLVSDGWFDFPLTQDDLGYAIGTTTVTVNKALQELRQANMIEQSGRKMRVTDLPALEGFALFDPAFLFLKPSPAPGDARTRPALRQFVADARRL